MSKKILITGSSSGFGKHTALLLLEKGHSVIASMRNVSGKNKNASEELLSAGARIVEIDVTNDESVNKGVEAAVEMAGGLDVVVNNAGAGMLGLQESFTIDDWKKMFELNLFGVHRINRAVLPHLRKQNSGLIIYLSSLVGRIVLPFMGPYIASKFALEALAETSRAELSVFGIDSCVVEPGGFGTNFFENILSPSDTSREEGYGDLANAPKNLTTNFGKAIEATESQKPDLVVQAIVNLIETPDGERKFRTVVDTMGMGDPVKSLNDLQEQITNGVYDGFQMGDMRKTNVLTTS